MARVSWLDNHEVGELKFGAIMFLSHLDLHSFIPAQRIQHKFVGTVQTCTFCFAPGKENLFVITMNFDI